MDVAAAAAAVVFLFLILIYVQVHRHVGPLHNMPVVGQPLLLILRI